ncbi:MAG: phosphoribosyl-AMP cyclohydrolase [Coriobacteriia bacterium]
MDRERHDLRVADLAFDERGLIPAIVQQHDTGEVLMLAWMDAEALERTLDTGRAWYWSRSRQAYWMKGESSGHVQEVVEVRYDCDGDALLVLVDQLGPACHTQERSCFYRTLYPTTAPRGSVSPPGEEEDLPLS